LFGKLDHGAGILVTAAVVGGRKNCDELTAGESLEAVHDALVCAEYILQVVVLKELPDPIRTKLDNVSGAVRVSNEVRLNAQFLVAVGRVRPQDVHDELLLGSGDLVHHFKRPLDGLDLVKSDKRLSNTSMQADESFFDHSS